MILFGLYVILAAADTLQTWAILSAGGEEINPVVRKAACALGPFLGPALLKLPGLLLVVVMLATESTYYAHVVVTLCIVHALVVTANYRNARAR